MDLTGTFNDSLLSLSGGSVSGKRYLLAVSGGMDSMCLADLFANSPLHPVFSIAHVNFSLRGEESDGDEKLVLEWASSHGILCHHMRFDTVSYAREHSLSIEMAARQLRYGWFESILKKNGYEFLAVAHNRNDSVETLFLNLLRGTGITGITGIRKNNGNIIRPLLDVTRDDIAEYVSFRSIPYRNDRTNFENDYARNKIRNLVFPVLKTINPSFLDTIAGDMEHFTQAAGILEESLNEVSHRTVHHESGVDIIDLAALTATGHREYYAYQLLSPFGFNSAQVHAILDTPASGHTFRSASHELLTGRGTLKIYTVSEKAPSPISIKGPGTFAFGYAKLSILFRPLAPDFDPHPAPGTLFFDATGLQFPLTCRSWQDGDRFRPFGMKGSRKLSDFFTTLKLDLRAKAAQPVLCDASGRIICIPPHRIDDRFRINSGSRSVGIITVDDWDLMGKSILFADSIDKRKPWK